MSEPDQPPTPDRLAALLKEGDHQETAAYLDRLGAADAETRKRALRPIRDIAEESSCSFEDLAGPLSTFLTDEDRAVRLTTAKLFVTLAQSDSAAVLPVVATLADRLVDDEEFYYFRARCAEALGYTAVDSPEEVTDLETLADLRIGLSFDESEVKEKLAKALAYVALGDPGWLRHQVDSLAEDLTDENELVQYHLCVAFVVVGCVHPKKLADADDVHRGRQPDENPYVQGWAVEALGLLAKSDVPVESTHYLEHINADGEETPSFLNDRLQFYPGRLVDELSRSTSAPSSWIERRQTPWLR
ncbi:HEAT repeat domain-containing protein [Haloarcula rubripromontorii]|uniref:HEAT repeat domain-containing protein n=1 Tax=Haloarcula rubripromontorii TaxID=1705562 RepID=UPI000B19B908|nr:HEAT repeat domain-containing protein [Haloarcula rubripromontorii]